MKTHHYSVTVQWTGNTGSGTSSYRGYERRHQISAGTKPPIPGSSDPAFRGDPACWNPEELLVAAISACHQLWYLHLCAEAGITSATAFTVVRWVGAAYLIYLGLRMLFASRQTNPGEVENLVDQDSLELARLIQRPGVQQSGVEQNDPPRNVRGRQVRT